MLKRATTAFALLAVLLVLLSPLTAGAQTASGPSTTSSLLVKLVGGLSAGEQAAVIARNGGVETSSIPALRLHVVTVSTADLPSVLAAYQADPQVQSVEVNRTRQSETMPADPLYAYQWALPRIGWEQVFGAITPAGSARVAVLDTGVDASHAELAGKVVPGISMLDSSDGRTDSSGHGTALAGIIAADTGGIPGEGIAGVAYAGVQIMPVTVLDANGEGQDSDVIRGVLWAADHGADVILMAFSAPEFSQNLQDAIDYAWSKGVVLVAAVGNDAVGTPTFPAGDRGVMGVAATDQNDAQAYFSNEGQAVFIAAPGVDIQTIDLNGNYVVLSGTSTAAAHVAGLAAFMKAVDPTLSNGVIVGRIARNADPAGTQDETGNGRINMPRALADTSTEPVQPAGADPVGDGGPFVGPYRAAACTLQSVSVGAQSPPSAAPGATVTHPVAVTKSGGSCTVNSLTVTGLPAGITSVSFSSGSNFSPPQTINFGGSPNTQNLTLTIITSSSTPAGPPHPTFTVTASGPTSGGQNIGAAQSGTGALTLVATDQTITVTTLAPGSATFDTSFGVAATASSGLPVAITTSGACSGSGSGSATITMTSGTGTCTVHYNQAGNASYNAAPEVTSDTTAQKANQATLTASASPNPLTYDETATLSTAGGNGDGTVSFSLVSGSCSLAGAQLTATSGTGQCKVTATKAADANYDAATSAEYTIDLQKADQATLTASASPNPLTYNETATLSAAGGNGDGAVSFSLVSGSCSLAGAQLTATSGTGQCKATATKAADANYNAATSAEYTIDLQKANQATLTASASPNPLTYNQTATLSTAGGNGDGAVSLSLVSGSCSLAGAQLTATSGTGQCKVTATKAADANYNATTSAEYTVDLQKANQAIGVTLGAPTSAVYDTTFSIAATGGGSGNPVVIAALGACAVDSGGSNGSATIRMTSGTGTCTVKYNQAGDGDYNAAPEVKSYTTAQKANQTINFGALPDKYFEDPNFGIVATATSGLAVIFTSDTPAVCSVASSVVDLLLAGTCTIRASQAGNNDYNPAPDVTQSFDVGGYTFTGFFRPIDSLPIVNVANSGQAIPVKFSLGGDQGLNIFAPGYPTSGVIACGTNDLYDFVDETVTAGGSSLQYDPATNQYTYVWKTEKSWAKTCRQLAVKLKDGTIHRANFNFTK